MAIQLEEVIPWGRSYDEYCRMFNLSENDLSGVTLGCGDGPASFNAEAHEKGLRVVSCDVIYQFDRGKIFKRIETCHPLIMQQVADQYDDFIWDRFRDLDELSESRWKTMNRFLRDYDAGRCQGRYVFGGLPVLPFAEGTFRLALVSHLLFLYSNQFDAEFHLAAVEGLLRVAEEARIYPVFDLEGKRSPSLDPVMQRLEECGHQVQLETVDYAFQHAEEGLENKMLRVIAAPTPQF